MSRAHLAVATLFALGLTVARAAPSDESNKADTGSSNRKATATETKSRTASPSKTAKSAGKAKAAAKADSGEGTHETKTERATFGGGCFWCLEAVFERIPGVKSVVSGYSGGTVPRPSYEMVCTGLTGHAEAVQVYYDPDSVTYDELLQFFFACHDPTTLNRQGPDEGTQYRSVIFYHNDDQRKAAKKAYDQLTAAGAYASPIVTQLVPMTVFFPAERYHQDYYRRHPRAEYCQLWIAPKVQKLKHLLEARQKQKRAAEAKDASAAAKPASP